MILHLMLYWILLRLSFLMWVDKEVALMTVVFLQRRPVSIMTL